MPLLRIISSLESLCRPVVSLRAQGLCLSYPDAAGCSQVFTCITPACDDLRIVQDESSLMVSHRHLPIFLARLGAATMGLKDAIEVFYLAHNADRAQWLAEEACASEAHTIMPEALLTIGPIALGPRPNQLLLKATLRMPDARSTETREIARSPSRVTFILDRSGSMREEQRLGMLKPAVIHTIDGLPADTLVSIYFYNHQLETIFENKPAGTITAADRTRILSIEPSGRTNITSVIPALVKNMHEEGLFENPVAFENLTLVWLTDGEDQDVKQSNHLAQLFSLHGCQAMPQLIAVGIGDYNADLLNGVAEDVRFKSNLMLHIDTPENTNALFHVVSGCIGVMRKHVILAIDVEGAIVYQDLGVMQAGQVKQVLMEIPMPSFGAQHIRCNVLLDDDVLRRDTPLPVGYNRQNIDLLVDYFTQLKDKMVLAAKNNPPVAEKMRALALASIPSTVRDRRLLALRQSFMPSDKVFSLLDGDLSMQLQSHAFFQPADEGSQRRYSLSLQNSYSSQA